MVVIDRIRVGIVGTGVVVGVVLMTVVELVMMVSFSACVVWWS